MSERSLRLLISVLAVVGVFVYLLSESMTSTLPVKVEDEGMLGGPISGLTRWQLTQFQEGKELFKKRFSAAEGLGPLYNAQSCADCHGGTGTAGGAGSDTSKSSVMLFAKRKADSKILNEPIKSILSKSEAKDLDYFLQEGGPVLLRNSISDTTDESLNGLDKNCKIEAAKDAPEKAEFRSKRVAPPLYGLGLVDSVSDQVFAWQSAMRAKETKDPKRLISGKQAQTYSPVKGCQSAGRFGSKGQLSDLLSATAFEAAVQLGLSNQIYKHSLSRKAPDQLPECMQNICRQNPNMDSQSLAKINFYLATLAAPPRGLISADSMKGEVIFQKLNCTACHVKQYRSPADVSLLNPESSWSFTEQGKADSWLNPVLSINQEPKFVSVRALEERTFSPYSDFLLHDLGPDLADGLAQGSANGAEWRTTPLWGLRLKRNFLHDGRAKTIDEAIKLHGGQAAQPAKDYFKLSEAEKKSLQAFFASL